MSVCVLCVFLFTCVHSCGGQRSVLAAFSCPPPYFMRQGLLLDLEPTNWLVWPASKLQRLSCVLMPGAGTTDVHCCSLDPSPDACTAEPLPQSSSCPVLCHFSCGSQTLSLLSPTVGLDFALFMVLGALLFPCSAHELYSTPVL